MKIAHNDLVMLALLGLPKKWHSYQDSMNVEIICTKHAHVLDQPDLTLFNFMQDTESIPLVNLLRKINCTHM